VSPERVLEHTHYPDAFARQELAHPPRQSLRLLGEAKVQGPDLQNILRQSYDNGKITIYLYDGRLKFAKHLTQDAVLFLCTIQLQNREIV